VICYRSPLPDRGIVALHLYSDPNNAPVPDSSLRLLHLTDMHLHASRDATMRGLNTFETFKAVVEHALASGHAIDAVLATGDLVQDETRPGYERFCELMRRFDAPVHCVPGNHDSPEIMAELLNQPPFQYCGSAIYSDWCVIMLNSAIRWDDCGRLGEQELAGLQTMLDAHRAQHILIGMHHHPLATGSRWLDGLNLRNQAEFFATIEPHANVRAIVWGHVHQASDRMHNGVRMLSTPSTGSQFRPNSDVFRLDTKPPGYRWIHLLPDGDIDTEIVWLD
jgi:Icc protein